VKSNAEHVPIRSCDITALARVLEGTRALDAETAAPAMRDAITEFLRRLDDGPFDEGDRELLRSALALGESDPRSSSVELVAAPKLRRRHKETLDCLLTGATEKEIAVQLGLSVHTVHQYVKAIYRRFRVTSRAQLMASRLRPVSALTGT
jgi:DNA-binding CsgD family transcriptional regulator